MEIEDKFKLSRLVAFEILWYLRHLQVVTSYGDRIMRDPHPSSNQLSAGGGRGVGCGDSP